MKKVLSVLLASAMIASVMAGCKSNSSSSSSQADMSGESIKYTVMIKGSYAEYPPDGGEAKATMKKLWEEKLGVTNTDYSVITATGDDYKTKLNTMMSGGDVPDYFSAGVDDIPTLVKNGLIAPIDDYVEQMPALKKLLEIPANKIAYDNFQVDGKHYGIPKIQLEGSLNGPDQGFMIRTDWLETLNLETPKTIDDLHNVLTAFTNDDPDKNGKADTYGLGGSKDNKFGTIFGAYGIYMNGINSWTEVDGKLVHSTVLPEVKDVLTLLSDWYKEGLIDPDAFVVEAKQTKDKFIAGKIGSYENSVWWSNDARNAWSKSDPNATCEMIDPVKGPDGKSGYPVQVVPADTMVISQNCVDKHDINRFIKLLDWSCDDSEDGGMKTCAFGIEGTHYTYDKANNTLDTSIAGDATNMYALGYSNPLRWVFVVDRRWIAKDDARYTDLGVTGNEDNAINTEFTSSVQAMKDYPDLYSQLWSEYFTKIVTGALPVSAFDEYVEKFNSQGGKELTEQVNEAVQ